MYEWFKGGVLVDNWEEVCREKTDVEIMHLEKGLQKEDTRSIVDIVVGNGMSHYDAKLPLLFNPMGMAVFDVAVGSYYHQAFKDRC
jgi:N-[(2S)-2-amino-2-carboxyethyl]-L-glutamate dehydrogenase